MALYVTAVDENSPAERLGISVGCALLAIDGHPLNDALDYQFYTTPAQFSLALCEHEQHRTVQVEKGEYEPLGCNFKTYLGDEKHSCSNHCMFCFIDQLPPGMREPLYFKDDDERLRVFYITQISTRPPTFVCFVNQKALFHFSYQRYLENQIRETFGLTGTPIKMITREHGDGAVKAGKV